MKSILLKNTVNRFCFVWLLLMLFNLLISIEPLTAQTNSLLRITRVDTANFPQVKVYAYTENVSPQTNLALRVTEDTVEKTVENIRERVGTQTVLILDASANIIQPGMTSAPMKDEAAGAIRRWVESGNLSPQSDWWQLLIPVAGEQVQTLQPWGRDHNAVSNALTNFTPDTTLTLTPLFKLIFTALDSFEAVGGLAPELQGALQRSIVVFSDGTSPVGAVDRTDVANRAGRLNLHIHTVLIGAEAPETKQNMESIAAVTGGQYFHLTALEQLDPLWETIVGSGYQQALTYRSSQAAPRQVCVQADLGEGRLLNDCRQPTIPPLPKVTVQVSSPGNNAILERQGAAHDTPLPDLEPKELPVEVELSWPTGLPRVVRQLEFTFNNQVQQLEVPADAQVVQGRLPIANLGAGSYTLLVKATDELGLVGEATPVTFQVQEVRPEAPLPTGQERATRFLRNYGLQLVAMILGIAALYFALRNPRVWDKATEVFNTVRTETEPWYPGRSKSMPSTPAKAQLILVEGEGEPEQTIQLSRNNTRLGRERSLVDTVIKNRHVSRLHCRISEEPDGSFKIWNEGSASGTYVNQEEVQFAGRILQDGDLINLGPVQYRFAYMDPTLPYGDGMQATEPFDRTQAFGHRDQAPGAAQPTQSVKPWDPDSTEPYIANANSTEPKPK